MLNADPHTPLIGNSSFINDLRKNIEKISQSNSRVLISGSKGSGKKLVAQNIHKASLKFESMPIILDFDWQH